MLLNIANGIGSVWPAFYIKAPKEFYEKEKRKKAKGNDLKEFPLFSIVCICFSTIVQPFLD